MSPIVRAYLQLCRPPNLPTAAADILAGLALAGFFNGAIDYVPLLLLLGASVFLYAGGVVFNDVFDYELDKLERPERPLPSGVVKPKNASVFGTLLFILGSGLAFAVSWLSGLLALALVAAILLYDGLLKKHPFFGPLNMGVCRGLNLLLGISVFGSLTLWAYAAVPVVFIFAVTTISRGEVYGNNKKNLFLAALLYVLVLISVMFFHSRYTMAPFTYLIFLSVFALLVFLPLYRAYVENTPKNIMKAVKAGVLSIIVLDAVLAVAHTNWQIGLLILLLLPLSIVLAKTFAVT